MLCIAVVRSWLLLFGMPFDEYITIILFCSWWRFCVFQYKAIIPNFVRNFLYMCPGAYISVGYILRIAGFRVYIPSDIARLFFQSGYINLCSHQSVVYDSSGLCCLPLKFFSSWQFNSILLQFKFAFLWLLMTLSTFSCDYCPFGFPFCEMSVYIFCWGFLWVDSFSYLLVGNLYIFHILVVYRFYVMQKSSLILGYLFILFMVFFDVLKFSIFM